MTRGRRPSAVLAAVLLAVLATGCGDGPAPVGAAPPPAPSAPLAEAPPSAEAGVLAERHTWGGMCAEGPCRSDLVVRTDGSWTLSTGTGGTSGVLDDAARAGLEQAVAATALADDVVPATACAADSDGTSVELVWQAPGAPPRSASSCEQVVAADDPLVRQLEAVAAAVTP